MTKLELPETPNGLRPFLLRGSLHECSESQDVTDMSPDPLPPVIQTGHGAAALARFTKVTEVKNETTDDE